MANILLTEKCVRSCPYCFAKKHMADAPDNTALKWDDLIYLADLFVASNERHVSLLGGEPTLHPDFIDFVIYLIERGFHVNVFTSGIMNDKKLEEAVRVFQNIPPDSLSFVCNLNDPKHSPFSEVECVKRFLKAFGHITAPGFNIYKPDFSMEFIFEYILAFGLRRNIRLGLTHPIPSEKNAFVKIDDMPRMAQKLIDYIPAFERLRVKPGFDCGFPLCIFNDDQLGKLYKLLGPQGTKFGCGPALDFGPDMTVWSCFPLSKFHKKSVYEFNSIQEISEYYNRFHHSVRVEAGGIYDKCDECLYRFDGMCAGGCLAHMLKEFHNEADRLRHQEVYKND